MNRDDDADWLDALGGRPAPDADPATRAEARLLRAAQRRWPAAAPAGSSADEAALIDRARREGLLGTRRGWCPGCAARWRRWMAQPWRLGTAGLALAAVLAAVVVVPLWREADEGPGPVLRAGPDGVALLRDADPRARRDRIAAALAGAGVAVRRYERLGRQGLDADLPQPLAPALRALLRREGLAVPAGATLRVEVEEVVP